MREAGWSMAPASRFDGLTALSGVEGQPVKPCGWKPQPLKQARARSVPVR